MKRRAFPGWRIVALTFFAQYMGWGLVGWAFALFVVPMETATGWGREALSLGVSLRLLMAGLVSPVVGSLMDRKGGARLVVVTGGLVGGLATVLLGAVQQLWQYYLLFGVVGGLATSAAFEMLGPVVIPKWFVRRRGLALALTNLGPPMAGVTMAPFMNFALTHWGWRLTWVGLGVLTWVLVVPLAAWCLHRRPEDVGLYPDGDPAPATSPGGPPVAEPQLSIRDVVRAPVVWLLVVAFASHGLASAALSVHRVPLLIGQGFSQSFATSVLFFNGLLSIVLKIPWGFVGDRYPVRWLLVLIMLSMVLGVFFLINASPDRSGWVALFVIFWSGAITGFPVLEPILWAGYFGRGALGRFRGITFPVFVAIRAAGPAIAGLAYTATGSYQTAFLGFMLYLVVGACLIYFAPVPRSLVAPGGRGPVERGAA